MDTAGRLLRLLGLLEGRSDWTSEELADRLEITTRTVRRDVARLRELGYPVEAMAGPGGGYRLGSGGSIPPLLLDDEEALAIAVSLRTSAGRTVGGFEEAALSVLAKLEPLLPPRHRSRLADVTSTTIALGGSDETQIDPETLAVLARAARNAERVRFVYTAFGRDPTERHVEPFRVVFAYRRWYLVAFDRDREDWRTFRLDRIARPESTGIRFTRVDPPDAAAQVEQGMASLAYRYWAKVTLETGIDEATRLVPPSIGRVEQLDAKRSILTIGADEPEWIVRFVARLNVDFEVTEPAEVVDAMRAFATRLLERHAIR